MKQFSQTFLLRRILILFLSVLVFTGCSKEYSIEPGDEAVLVGSWQFFEGNNFLDGYLDSSYIISGRAIDELHLKGFNPKTKDRFHLVVYANSFEAGKSYPASEFQSSFDYGNQTPYLYTAGQLIGEFVVTITSFSNGMMTGVFEGNVLKEGTETANLSDGSFKVILRGDANLPASEGVLGSASGNCLPAVIEGEYFENYELNESNTVTVQVSVTSPGAYHIYTDPANGVSFAATGNFEKAGQHSVKLTSSGTPSDEGDFAFTLHYGNSLCQFKINFRSEIEAPNDYFPTTDQSYWRYDTDPSYIVVTGEKVSFDGKTYKTIGSFKNLGDTDFTTVFNIRKQDGNYFNLVDYSDYTGESQPQLLETIFLKESAGKGDSWDGPAFQVTQNGIPAQAKLRFTILDKEVMAQVGPFTFPNVIKVKTELFAGGTATGITEEFWYGKNVGLVYYKDADGNITRISDYLINII